MTDAAINPKGPPFRPLKALQAFDRLRRNKEDTVQVFEIMRALAGQAIYRGYDRLICTPGGGEIAYARQELAAVFSDKAWLGGFAPGTVGARYREFMAAEQLSAEGLVMQSQETDPEIEEPNVLRWYARRLRDIHDVWHVLTGYGRDALGEACVVAFSYAQTGNLGFGFLALAAAREIHRETPKVGVWSAVLEAFRHGRQARWLPGQSYERLFAEPLEAARARLNIAPPDRYLAVPEDVRRALKLRAT